MSKFQVAVILTVEADNYEKAEDQVVRWSENALNADSKKKSGIARWQMIDSEEVERDGSAADQRVIYLHNEQEPIED